MKILFSYILLFVTVFTSNGQCPEMSTGKTQLENQSLGFQAKVKVNKLKNKIDVIGGYIHETDSIHIWKCSKLIYSDIINNDNVHLDGLSFSITLNGDLVNEYFLQLDNCYFPLKIPLNIGVILIEKTSPILSVEYY